MISWTVAGIVTILTILVLVYTIRLALKDVFVPTLKRKPVEYFSPLPFSGPELPKGESGTTSDDDEDKPDPNEVVELVRVARPRYLTPIELEYLPDKTDVMVWRTGRSMADRGFTSKDEKRVILRTNPMTNIDMERFGQSREKGPVAKLWIRDKSNASKKNANGPSRA